jgi:uncharacterized protein (TIGR02246 family)
MSEIDELRRRIDRLESRHEIAELVSAYAVACDEHDVPRLVGLFTADAELDSPSKVMVARGRDAIERFFVRVFKTRGPAYHWTHDHFVRFDDTDPARATGLVLSHAETTPGNEVSLAAMRYNDAYRREDNRWRFAKRVISYLYYVPARDYATSLSSEKRVVVGGERRPADYPESLPSWREFERGDGRE